MKRILLLLCLACSLTAVAQSRYVRVTTLKGTVYEGALKEFKAFQHVVVEVNGQKVTIPYKEMAYIDDLKTIKVEYVEAQSEPEPVIPESVVEPEPEPVPVLAVVPEPVAEPEPEPEPVPVLAVVPEPVAEPEPEPALAVVPESVTPDPVVPEPVAPAPVVSEPVAPKPTYKGFLLSAGNKVYLNCVSEPTNGSYNDAALDVLKRQLRRDSFWTMVDNPADAHFAINYTLTMDGRGKTVLSISSDYVENMEMLGSSGIPEDVDDYRKIVYDLYQKYLLTLQKKIEAESVPKRTKKLFTVE